MTSEIRGNKEVAPPQPIPDEPACLCCLHFAVDFDVMPEARKRFRPSRQPKRHAE
jgi:hypothetical protein